MITLSWDQLNKMGNVLDRLSRDVKAGAKAQYRAGKIMVIGRKEVPKIEKMKRDTFKKYQKLDENLNPKFDADGNAVFTDGEVGAQNCLEEIMAAMEKNTFCAMVEKLDWNDVSHLTGSDLVAIEEIINGGVPENYAG